MKQPNKNFNDWIFQGRQSGQESFRGNPVGRNSWYIGTCNGTIEAGPFRTEQSAIYNCDLMKDTSGT